MFSPESKLNTTAKITMLPCKCARLNFCVWWGLGNGSVPRPNALHSKMQVELLAYSSHTMSTGMRHGTYTPVQRPVATLHGPDVLLQRSNQFLIIGKQGVENALKTNISKWIY